LTLPGWHWPVLSTQPLQLVSSQPSEVHICAPTQAWQLEPPVPQSAMEEPARQPPSASQQPVQVDAHAPPPSGLF
jgi:hypothetical protein